MAVSFSLCIYHICITFVSNCYKMCTGTLLCIRLFYFPNPLIKIMFFGFRFRTPFFHHSSNMMPQNTILGPFEIQLGPKSADTSQCQALSNKSM